MTIVLTSFFLARYVVCFYIRHTFPFVCNVALGFVSALFLGSPFGFFSFSGPFDFIFLQFAFISRLGLPYTFRLLTFSHLVSLLLLYGFSKFVQFDLIVYKMLTSLTVLYQILSAIKMACISSKVCIS